MPNLSAEEYLEMKRLIDTPGLDLSDEERTRAINAVQAFDNQSASAFGAAPAAPTTPDITTRLDPNSDLMPQVLAIQPATTHPGGDEAAGEAGAAGAPSGTIYVYEPPLAVVRKKLLEDPQIARSLMPNLYGSTDAAPPDPAKLAQLTTNDSLYQAYADNEWRKTAESALNSGKTAYRYSKSPWLHNGQMSAVESLGTKAKGAIKPAAEASNAFVLGVDDTALFGAGRAALEAVNPEISETNSQLGIESVGGVPTSDARTRNRAIEEENPIAYGLGQGAGLFWGGAKKAYDFVAKGGEKVAARLGGGAAARLGAAAGAAAGGAALDQAGHETVDATSSLVNNGTVGPNFWEGAGSRVSGAALNPINLGMGVAGEAIGQVAAKGADVVREGPRYKGAPGRFERSGGKIEFGKGPVAAPETEAALKADKAMDVAPGESMRKELAPKIAAAEEKAVAQVKLEVADRNAPYLASNEGQMLLPAPSVQQQTLDILDSHVGKGKGGELRPLPKSQGTIKEMRKVFNGNTAEVSTKPVEGAIALSPEQAEAFLNPEFQQKLRPKGKKKPPTPPTTGAREVDLPVGGEPPSAAAAEPNVREAGTVPPPGKAKKADGVVQGKADRDVTPTVLMKGEFGEARNEYGEAMAPYRSAQQADNARAAKLKDGPGMDPDRHLAAANVPEWKEGAGKAYISDMYEQAKGKFKTRDEFDAALLKAHRGTKGGLLDRLDLVAAADAGKLKASTVKAGNAEYDLVSTKEAGRLLKEWGLLGAGTVAAASQSDDEQGEAGATGAAVVGLAKSLRRRGIEKVYVVPRRYTAAQHETFTKTLQTLSADPQNPSAREARKIYEASLRDRDARPMDGKPGGWSAWQAENSQMIERVKSRAQQAAPGGDAMTPLVNYSQQRPGEILQVEALRSAADRAGGGAREQLDRIRQLDPLQSLQGQMRIQKPLSGGGRTVYGTANAAFDWGNLRYGYPAMSAAGAEGSGIRGGRAGRASVLQRDEDKKKDKTP